MSKSQSARVSSLCFLVFCCSWVPAQARGLQQAWTLPGAGEGGAGSDIDRLHKMAEERISATTARIEVLTTMATAHDLANQHREQLKATEQELKSDLAQKIVCKGTVCSMVDASKSTKSRKASSSSSSAPVVATNAAAAVVPDPTERVEVEGHQADAEPIETNQEQPQEEAEPEAVVESVEGGGQEEGDGEEQAGAEGGGISEAASQEEPTKSEEEDVQTEEEEQLEVEAVEQDQNEKSRGDVEEAGEQVEEAGEEVKEEVEKVGGEKKEEEVHHASALVAWSGEILWATMVLSGFCYVYYQWQMEYMTVAQD